MRHTTLSILIVRHFIHKRDETVAVTSINLLDSVVDITAQTEFNTISENLITIILQLTPSNQVLTLNYNPNTIPTFMVIACSNVFLF